MDRPKLAELKFSPLARADLELIWIWTEAEWSLDQAFKYNEIIEAGINVVLRNPTAYQVQVIRGKSFRLAAIGSHLIIYHFAANVVTVVRIMHPRQDWQRVLGRAP